MIKRLNLEDISCDNPTESSLEEEKTPIVTCIPEETPLLEPSESTEHLLQQD